MIAVGSAVRKSPRKHVTKKKDDGGTSSEDDPNEQYVYETDEDR